MSMQGKVVVVTGSNVGIGFETVVGLAAQEATTVLACRNQAKAEAAAREVTRRTWNDDVHVIPLDLADLASVRKAAQEIRTRWDRLDVLVNNAGGTWSARQETAQGFEYTFGVNHLGSLLPHQPLAAPATRRRAVPHHQPDLGGAPCGPPWHALRGPPEQEALRGHGGLLPLEARQRPVYPPAGHARLDAGGDAVTVNAAHPGPVRSSFGMDGDLHGFMGFGMRLVRPFEISPKRGAKTSLHLATSPDVAGKTGQYWVRSKPGHMSRQARDDEAAARLWDESEQLLASVGYGIG